ncbi:TM0106 family RecB-like putative nuclease [Bdellovibrionota bacterium FG-1]
MKRLKDGIFRFSPSDLTTYLESPFSAWMDRCAIEFPEQFKSDPDDDSAELIKRKGNEHEARVLAYLKTKHGHVEVIPSEGDFESRHNATLAAMSTGHGVIYQGALKCEPFIGYADFLVKVAGQSKLGTYHYEAWDSKLARKTKPYFVIQLLAYSEMLDEIQDVFPATITVVLGTNEHKVLKTSDFRNYYQSVKRRYLEFNRTFNPKQQPIPEKSEEIRSWTAEAKALITRTDHLSQVAGIRGAQIRKLEAAGITTLATLASTLLEKIPDMEKGTLQKLKRQARLQVASKGLPVPKYEILEHEEDARVGLRLLPRPSIKDVYFDMEGYPLFEDKGLEYLFGAIYEEAASDGKEVSQTFIDFWAHDRAQEKRAFEAWIDWVYARFKSDPKMHIYHYASYEVTAMRKLSTMHATREAEVDEFLKKDVFVDLYRIVTQGLVVGEDSYSIKKIEHLFGQKREGDVTNAGDSIVEYANYLAMPDGADYKMSPTLKNIRDYNEVDCVSTLKLCNWLRAVQKESKLDYLMKTPQVEEEIEREVSPATQLAQSLLSELNGKSELTADETVQKLLAELLEFHRREAKQYWWKYFDWINSTHDELVDQSECIGNVRRTEKALLPDKQSLIAEYRFDPGQDIKFVPGSDCQVYMDHDNVLGAEIRDLDTGTGLFTVRVSKKKLEKVGGFPAIASILPGGPISTKVMTESLFAIVSRFKETKLRHSLPKAIAELLYRTLPQVDGHKTGAPLIAEGDLPLECTIDLIKRMNETTICIQGPPGAGKTYTGSHVIHALLKAGQRVGVTSNSHKAIENLMAAVLDVAKKTGFEITGFKSGGEPGILEKTGLKKFETKDIAGLAPAANGHILIGGTAWTFSREEACSEGKEVLDYLFVDEAGQVSLANLVAMSRSTKNIVLMGDQRQLEQPIQGSHPGESGESCLNYLIQDHATIPAELGIFLGTTFRMRPDVCKFVSDNFYESRLVADGSTLETELILHPTCKEVGKSEGILFIPVEHEDCSQSSREEAATINAMIGELLKSQIKDANGTRPLTLKDILVVAPYNLQVNLLKQTLPKGIEIGSVDKFQGREAPVVILSMCSSTLDATPRGVDFLFSPNRLNVALSRAKCLAIVVGNPALAATDGTSIEKMKMVNLFCGVVNC